MFFTEDYPKREERLPRALAEQVMAQLEHPRSLAKFDDPAYRLITMILMRCGLRVTDALRLRADCLVSDADGAPYLRYVNHKMKREALVPLDEELLADRNHARRGGRHELHLTERLVQLGDLLFEHLVLLAQFLLAAKFQRFYLLQVAGQHLLLLGNGAFQVADHIFICLDGFFWWSFFFGSPHFPAQLPQPVFQAAEHIGALFNNGLVRLKNGTWLIGLHGFAERFAGLEEKVNRNA